MTEASTQGKEVGFEGCPVCLHATPHAQGNAGRFSDPDESFCEDENCFCTAWFRHNAIVARDAALSASRPTGEEARPVWRCYHCNAAFTKRDLVAAREHFGLTDGATPVCIDSLQSANAELRQRVEELERERERLQMFEPCMAEITEGESTPGQFCCVPHPVHKMMHGHAFVPWDNEVAKQKRAQLTAALSDGGEKNGNV